MKELTKLAHAERLCSKFLNASSYNTFVTSPLWKVGLPGPNRPKMPNRFQKRQIVSKSATQAETDRMLALLN